MEQDVEGQMLILKYQAELIIMRTGLKIFRSFFPSINHKVYCFRYVSFYLFLISKGISLKYYVPEISKMFMNFSLQRGKRGRGRRQANEEPVT